MYDFVVNSMLGKLSKWLRVLGYSVFYNPRASDNELIRIAKNTRAPLITRDRELYSKAINDRVNTFLIKSTDIIDMLLLLHKKFNIRLDINFDLTRCSKCNAKLKRCDKSLIYDKVPKEILKRYNVFLVCPKCNSIYWPGKHYKNMILILKTVKELSSS